MEGIASPPESSKNSRERHKNIYLISHRDELQGRVNSVLKVTKEGGFTTYAFVDNAG